MNASFIRRIQRQTQSCCHLQGETQKRLTESGQSSSCPILSTLMIDDIGHNEIGQPNYHSYSSFLAYLFTSFCHYGAGPGSPLLAKGIILDNKGSPLIFFPSLLRMF